MKKKNKEISPTLKYKFVIPDEIVTLKMDIKFEEAIKKKIVIVNKEKDGSTGTTKLF